MKFLIMPAKSLLLVSVIALLLLHAGPAQSQQPVSERPVATDLAAVDSLYSYAYIRHRIHTSFGIFSIPRAVKRHLADLADISVGVSERMAGKVPAEYGYLRYWVMHPLLSEAEAQQRFADSTGVGGRPALVATENACNLCGGDTTGYTRFRQQVTALSIATDDAVKAQDYAAAFRYRDSLVALAGLTRGDMAASKRLAIKLRDTSRYLHTFHFDSCTGFAEKREQDLSWSTAFTPEDKAFVSASLAGIQQRPTATGCPVMSASQLVFRRFDRFHDAIGRSVFGAYSPVAQMIVDKDRLRALSAFLAEETYTAVPAALCRALAAGERIPHLSSDLNYFATHLVQYNSWGIHYPSALIEDYLSALRCLAYRRVLDMEDYTDSYDSYQTAVLDRPTQFGLVYDIKHGDREYTRITPEVIRNRAEYGLPPLRETKD